MEAKKALKQVFEERNTDINGLAAKLNMKPQSLRNKINRGTYSLADFIEWMDLLDCDLQIVTRDTHKTFY
jgi:hypothetical protein